MYKGKRKSGPKSSHLRGVETWEQEFPLQNGSGETQFPTVPAEINPGFWPKKNNSSFKTATVRKSAAPTEISPVRSSNRRQFNKSDNNVNKKLKPTSKNTARPKLETNSQAMYCDDTTCKHTNQQAFDNKKTTHKLLGTCRIFDSYSLRC